MQSQGGLVPHVLRNQITHFVMKAQAKSVESQISIIIINLYSLLTTERDRVTSPRNCELLEWLI